MNPARVFSIFLVVGSVAAGVVGGSYELLNKPKVEVKVEEVAKPEVSKPETSHSSSSQETVGKETSKNNKESIKVQYPGFSSIVECEKTVEGNLWFFNCPSSIWKKDSK